MKAGNGWTKNTEKGNTLISVSIDEVILDKYPELRKYNITLWHIPSDRRKSENSPHWDLDISLKKEKEKPTVNSENDETFL